MNVPLPPLQTIHPLHHRLNTTNEFMHSHDNYKLPHKTGTMLANQPFQKNYNPWLHNSRYHSHTKQRYKFRTSLAYKPQPSHI